jgi:hypothetical protein
MKKRVLAVPTLPREAEIDRKMRVAIIVPYRDRADHLARFFAHFRAMESVVPGGHCEIFVIEQLVPGHFNRGLLLNAGFVMALRSGPFDRYIFHDVDSYPSPVLYKQYFAFPGRNIHYASPYLEYKYHYPSFVGGVIAFGADDYARVNGFPNAFFGWGGEDDALYNRLLAAEIPIWRPRVGKYVLVDHDGPASHEKNMVKHENKAADAAGWRDDGIIQLIETGASVSVGVLDVRYRRLDAPVDGGAVAPPETNLAHFRPPRTARRAHFYGLDWTREPGSGPAPLVGGGGPGGYDYKGTPAPGGAFIDTIRAFARPVPRRARAANPRVALLFMVQSAIPLLNIWTQWLADAPAGAFDVLIHSTRPEALAASLGDHLFRLCIVNGPHSPAPATWGSLELTQTAHYLMEVALEVAPDATHMVFLSESCVPVVRPANLLALAGALGSRSRFRIETAETCGDTKYSLPRQFQTLAREFPPECVLKTDQWVMLSRAHAAAIVDLSREVPVWPIFNVIPKASDEMFMASMLCAALGGLGADDVDARPITYKEWTAGSPHPHSYATITRGLAAKARRNGACFLRKIRPPADATAEAKLARQWRSAVMES